MELKGKIINFLGDSITEGVGVSCIENTFVSRIATSEDCICHNYGIGGTRIAKQTVPSEKPSHDLDFCGRVGSMDKNADIVVVFGGTNDFGHGDAPLGQMNDRNNNTFYGALHVLYQSLINQYLGKTIVILTPLHRSNEDNPKGDKKENDVATLKEYVNIIREVAEFYSLPVLDLYSTSGLQPRVPIIQETYIPDGLHPNDAGHEILAHKIILFLKNI